MSRCYQCGTKIAFKMLPSGRKCPTNLDGSDHFDLCSKLKFQLRLEEYGGYENAPESVTGHKATPKQLAGFEAMRKADRAQPWFVSKGLPWNDYAPANCECGEEYEMTARDCTVTLACRKCVRVRIESSYSVAYQEAR